MVEVVAVGKYGEHGEARGQEELHRKCPSSEAVVAVRFPRRVYNLSPAGSVGNAAGDAVRMYQQ